jgi:hypothetical protein
VPLSPYGGMAQRRNLRWLMVIGRLRQGSTFAQASAEMQTINAGLADQQIDELRFFHTPAALNSVTLEASASPSRGLLARWHHHFVG